MTREKEIILFDWLFRHRPLREWLQDQLGKQIEILMSSKEHDVLMKAQGAAWFIKDMLGRLDAAESAANKR